MPPMNHGQPFLQKMQEGSKEALLSSKCDVSGIPREEGVERAIRAILIHREEYVMRGAESHHSQVFFPHLTKEQVSLVVDTHGAAPYFGIQPLKWY